MEAVAGTAIAVYNENFVVTREKAMLLMNRGRLMRVAFAVVATIIAAIASFIPAKNSQAITVPSVEQYLETLIEGHAYLPDAYQNNINVIQISLDTIASFYRAGTPINSAINGDLDLPNKLLFLYMRLHAVHYHGKPLSELEPEKLELAKYRKKQVFDEIYRRMVSGHGDWKKLWAVETVRLFSAHGGTLASLPDGTSYFVPDGTPIPDGSTAVTSMR